MSKIKEVYSILKSNGVRVHLDDRENYNPGFKYNHWELRGVPVRIELGMKDLKK
jgi:prolyl-tRNA synthetase